MTLTMEKKRKENFEVTIEYEKFGCCYARVYERWGDEWHKISESHPYKDEKKVKAAYRRFIKKYL